MSQNSNFNENQSSNTTPSQNRAVFFDDSVFRDDIIDNNPFFKKKAKDNLAQSAGLDSLLANAQSHAAKDSSTPSELTFGATGILHSGFDVDKDKQQISKYISDAMRQGREKEVKSTVVAPVVEQKQDFFILEHDMRYVAKNDTYDGYYEDILPIDEERVSREIRNKQGAVRLFLFTAVAVIIVIIILIVGRFIIDLYVGGTPV